jgi:hypothetical protein
MPRGRGRPEPSSVILGMHAIAVFLKA